MDTQEPKTRPIVVETAHLMSRLEFFPPSSLKEAEDFCNECTRRILEIETKLGENAFRHRIGVPPSDKLECMRWRKRATCALAALISERMKAKAWIKENKGLILKTKPPGESRPRMDPRFSDGGHRANGRALLRRFLWVAGLVKEENPDATREMDSLEGDIRAYLASTVINPAGAYSPEGLEATAARAF